ncbi:hypothetical protein ATK74_2961 [Propionicimonas paludicola]|uniref:Uncharacterized protein n=1 Tax=Propionicimonas paludicola TaxID=185243 RepID=A0A2A9CW67_9ACTN|nr:hypothetical protein [Propionicimonas paludicola]PFG18376.1 hypothetical protein ATK74_2961 [Propionicimonas paludicola]
MPPLEIAAWVIGAVGLAGVAWAFFKSDSLRVRLGALGVFGVAYLGILALGWGTIEWFNATTIGLAAIALLSRMKAPLAPKPSSDAAPVTDVTDAEVVDDSAQEAARPTDETQPPA